MSLHKYLYANADPANLCDPSGLFSLVPYALLNKMGVSKERIAALNYLAMQVSCMLNMATTALNGLSDILAITTGIYNEGVSTILDISSQITFCAVHFEVDIDIKPLIKTHKHHTTPKAIIKRLPPHLKNNKDIKGRKGLPNKKPIPETKHRQIHSGTGSGGDYNRRFNEELGKLNPDESTWRVDDILKIRDRLGDEFDL